MSPEIDLLDQLNGGDKALNLALRIFGWPEKVEALERVRHSVSAQVSDGFIDLKLRSSGEERMLPLWESKQVLGEDINWLKQGKDAVYYLCLTEKGGTFLS